MITSDSIRLTGARRATARLFGLACLVAILVLVQLLVDRGWVTSFLVPRPTDVVMSFPMLVREEQLIGRLAVTIGEAVAAVLLAAFIGGVAGWALFRWRNARLAFRSWVVALNAAPSLLVYPLFLVIFGRGVETVATLGTLSALPPIILKTCDGLLGTRKVLLDVGRSFDLSPLQQFRLVLFPAAVPTIFTGVRIGLIYALMTTISIQFLVSSGGLGGLVSDLADRYEIAALFGAIVFIIVVSALLQISLERLERWLRPV